MFDSISMNYVIYFLLVSNIFFVNAMEILIIKHEN